MLENVQAYLSKQGVKYIKPEKAVHIRKRWKTSRHLVKQLVRRCRL